MLRIIISPAFDKRGRFEARRNDRLVCVSKQPLLDAARVLVGEGIPSDTMIATRHVGADFDALTSTIGVAAALTVSESNTEGPIFRPWKAFSSRAVDAPMRSGSDRVSETASDAEGSGTAELRAATIRCRHDQ